MNISNDKFIATLVPSYFHCITKIDLINISFSAHFYHFLLNSLVVFPYYMRNTLKNIRIWRDIYLWRMYQKNCSRKRRHHHQDLPEIRSQVVKLCSLWFECTNDICRVFITDFTSFGALGTSGSRANGLKSAPHRPPRFVKSYPYRHRETTVEMCIYFVFKTEAATCIKLPPPLRCNNRRKPCAVRTRSRRARAQSPVRRIRPGECTRVISSLRRPLACVSPGAKTQLGFAIKTDLYDLGPPF